MTLPWVQKAELDVTSLTTSMNLSAVAFVAPYACTITAVQYVPNSTQGGGIDVNHRMLSLYNRGRWPHRHDAGRDARPDLRSRRRHAHEQRGVLALRR